MLRKEVLQKQFQNSQYNQFKYIFCYRNPETIHSLACSPDNTHLLIGSDKNIYYLDMTTGEKNSLPCRHFVNSIAFNRDGSLALIASVDKFATLYDCLTNKYGKRLGPHDLYISAVALNPEGNLALTGSWDEYIGLWDLNIGKLIKIFNGHRCIISGLAFLDEDKILSSSWDGTLRIWSIKSDDFEELSRHTEPISSLAVSKNLHFALYSSNSDAYFMDLKTKRILLILKHPNQIKSIALNSDGSFALVSCNNNFTYLWNLKTKIWHILFFNPYENTQFVTFNADDQYAIIGSKKTIYILKLLV